VIVNMCNFRLHFSKNYDTVLTRNKSRRFNFDTYFSFHQREHFGKSAFSLFDVMKYVYLETFVSQQMRTAFFGVSFEALFYFGGDAI